MSVEMWKTGKIERFKILLHFAFLLHFALYRVNAKCNKNNAKCSKFYSTWYMLVVWSEIVEYNMEMFSITNFY